MVVTETSDCIASRAEDLPDLIQIASLVTEFHIVGTDIVNLRVIKIKESAMNVFFFFFSTDKCVIRTFIFYLAIP